MKETSWTPEERMLYQLRREFPQYKDDFLIDDFGDLAFGLEDDDFYIKYNEDTWQVVMPSVHGDQPEAYEAVSSFKEALEIYFGHKINRQ